MKIEGRLCSGVQDRRDAAGFNCYTIRSARSSPVIWPQRRGREIRNKQEISANVNARRSMPAMPS